MVEDRKVARHDFVFKDSTVGNVDATSMIGYDDNSTSQHDTRSKGHIAGDCQVMQFLRNRDSHDGLVMTGRKITGAFTIMSGMPLKRESY